MTFLLYIYQRKMRCIRIRDRHGHDGMVDALLPMQSVPITTNVVTSNTTQARCTRYAKVGQ
jgi:hypothetical protein